MNNGHSGMSIVPTVLGGELGAYSTALAGPGPKRKLDREALADFIRTWLGAGEHRCTGYFLQRHDPGSGRDTIVQATLLPGKGKKHTQEEEEQFVQQLVERVDRASSAVAEQHARNSLYFVGACKVLDNDLHAIDEFPFTVSPPPEIAASFHQNGDGGETSISSVVGTMQRHADTAIRSKDANVQQCMDRMQEDLHYTKTQNRELMDQIFEMSKERNVLLDESATRAIRVEKERLHMELTQKLVLEVAGYAMKVIKQIVANKTGITGAGVDSKVVAALGALEPKHLLPIISILNQLPEEHRAKLSPVLDMVSESMSQEKKDKLALAMMQDPDPAAQAAAADAAGKNGASQ